MKNDQFVPSCLEIKASGSAVTQEELCAVQHKTIAKLIEESNEENPQKATSR